MLPNQRVQAALPDLRDSQASSVTFGLKNLPSRIKTQLGHGQEGLLAPAGWRHLNGAKFKDLNIGFIALLEIESNLHFCYWFSLELMV